jgi:allantoinase
MAVEFDLLIRGAEVVRPGTAAPERLDLAIRDGRIALLEPAIAPERAAAVHEAEGLWAFPGAVDAHMHTGIYNPLAEDAVSESQAAAMGGVTSSLNYIRTGQYYLNKSGPYRQFYPEVLELSAGRYHVDYGYHIAPMMAAHIDELEWLIEQGVASFKIFMFYGQYGLHGRSSDQSSFLMIPSDEYYDIAHFEFVMRGLRRAMERFPHLAGQLSLSLHCETAEIMRAYTRIVEREGKLTGLRAYHASRPPHSEGLAIFIASYLANETDCANINLLHLTSAKAVNAALQMAEVFPHIDFKREVTIAHLLLDVEAECGNHAKVNPPIRPRADVEYLWDALLAGKIDWVCSDHACCKAEYKLHRERPGDVFLAKSGFGGTEYLLPALLSEGRKRGLSPGRVAELVSRNPARRYGLNQKGDLAPGMDADVVLVDPKRPTVVDQHPSPSSQGYSVFAGMRFDVRVVRTYLRGGVIWDEDRIVGAPQGRYLHRPTAGPQP